MAKKKQKTRGLRRMMKGGLVRLTARETPPAGEIKGEMNGGTDGLDLSNGHVDMRLPTHFGGDDEGEHWLRLGSIMSAILAAGVTWIGIVCWLVSQMPDR